MDSLTLRMRIRIITGDQNQNILLVDYSCRECIPIPNGVWKETVLIKVSSSIWHLKCHWMLIPTAPIWGLKVVTRYTLLSAYSAHLRI